MLAGLYLQIPYSNFWVYSELPPFLSLALPNPKKEKKGSTPKSNTGKRSFTQSVTMQC